MCYTTEQEGPRSNRLHLIQLSAGNSQSCLGSFRPEHLCTLLLFRRSHLGLEVLQPPIQESWVEDWRSYSCAVQSFSRLQR